MPEPETDLFEESVGAFVLGALDEAEGEAMRAHLKGCARCRSIEAELRQTTDLLPLVAPEIELPPDLRDRIIRAASAASAIPTRRMQRRHHPPSTRTWGLPRGSRWPRIRLAVAALTVLVLALAGLSAWNVSLQGQLHQADTAIASRTIRPTSSAMAEAKGRALVLNDQQLVVVSFNNMPPLAPGHVYELWLGSQGTFVPAGVFSPDARGSKVVVVREGRSSYSVIALTVEPGPNGTSTPTQAPGMGGSL